MEEYPPMAGIPLDSYYCYKGDKKCMHWYPRKDGAYCTFLKIESVREDNNSLLWDMVKECNINYPEVDDMYFDTPLRSEKIETMYCDGNLGGTNIPSFRR